MRRGGSTLAKRTKCIQAARLKATIYNIKNGVSCLKYIYKPLVGLYNAIKLMIIYKERSKNEEGTKTTADKKIIVGYD